MFGQGKEIQDMSLAAFEREFKVNTVGTFLLNRAAVKHFIAQNERGVAAPQGGWSIV
jgi:NAD(P)-dependent dehydrogenase (short-subunit alcohol dehydrogenase family)